MSSAPSTTASTGGSGSAPITLHRGGEIAELVIDRAEKRNAMSLAMWQAIPVLVAEADADPAIKALIVRGDGAHFCAGADIGEFREQRSTPEAAARYGDTIEAATHALARMSIPSIAVVRGFCIGGGCELALACDLRLADTTSRLAITPATLGIVYGYSSTRRLVSVVGPSFAKYLLLSANKVTAEEAHRVRMIDQLLAPEDLQEAARTLATTIGGRSQVSVRGGKRLVEMAVAGVPTDDPEATSIPLDAVTSADYAEGVAAFLEKRPPRVSGSTAGHHPVGP